MNFPISKQIIEDAKRELNIKTLASASIRDLVGLVDLLEMKTGVKYVRMEMGVPGLTSPQVGIDAEKAALDKGVSAIYPQLDGIPELKHEMVRFAKLFMNVDVTPRNCVATVGSMQAMFMSFMVSNRCHKERSKGTLFIDPGFNINKMQVRILEQEYDTFDIANFRGQKLREKLESYLSTGQFQSIIYSNPNNPTWQCLTDEELQIIGELANKYDVVVIEDLAYFGMDFREDYSHPGMGPFVPSVSKYTDNYLILISSSKSFSYAGQRVGMMFISPKLHEREFPDLEKSFGRKRYGEAMVSAALYCLSSGVSHSAQYGLTGILKAANDGIYNYREDVKIYGEKAHAMKRIFTDNGFHIVYDKDGNDLIADGFYFTVAYKNLDSNALLEKLLEYGMCTITLDATGSDFTGVLRICTSQVKPSEFATLEERVRLLNESCK